MQLKIQIAQQWIFLCLNKNLSANILELINNSRAKSKIDIEEVLEKTTKTSHFNSNAALNNPLDDSKGGIAQVIFNAAYSLYLTISIINISKTLFVKPLNEG